MLHCIVYPHRNISWLNGIASPRVILSSHNPISYSRVIFTRHIRKFRIPLSSSEVPRILFSLRISSCDESHDMSSSFSLWVFSAFFFTMHCFSISFLVIVSSLRTFIFSCYTDHLRIQNTLLYDLVFAGYNIFP